jgi:dipeptidyl aminopeptidase/acylaminoacyl peptidase
MRLPCLRRAFCTVMWTVVSMVLLPDFCLAQSVADLQRLTTPQHLEFSPDSSRLWYKLGANWWRIDTAPNSQPERDSHHQSQEASNMPQISSNPRVFGARTSPNGNWNAYLDAEHPYGAQLLFCVRPDQPDNPKPQPLSQMPILAFQWASNSQALWVIAADGADEPVGRITLDGRFEQLTQSAAMRRIGGLVSANDVLAWVQSDSGHSGTIWLRDRAGNSRMLVNPNPQTARWSRRWTQEVVRWKNAHGEELQGILAMPTGRHRLPLVVDPYSSWRNRFLNIPVLGNYEFVRAGFGVFFPDHRAPYTFPEMAFGTAYVGASKDRDPVDVLTDDVMSGVAELIRRGVADPRALFLYSSSNGASAIDQLLTQTDQFRAAVSHGGVADWLGYYNKRHLLGDETIPGFLGGRKPDDSPDLYCRISPVYHTDKIDTPLLLVIGEKDTRYTDTVQFYDSLLKLGKPVTLVVYPGEGHEFSTVSLADQHVRRAIRFFRASRRDESK